VANKIDVQNREVSYEDGLAYAQKIGAEYIETSAKKDENVSQAFITLATLIRNKKKSEKLEVKNNSSGSIHEVEKLDTKGHVEDDKDSNKGFMNWLFSKCNLI
jgi:50S ribosomal subunit-associated GTPase HflX